METQMESSAKQTHTIMSALDKRERLDPATKTEWLEMRTKDITSTEVSALFGLSPYMTQFELWHQKKNGTVVEHPGNERTQWGTRLEASIAHGIAEDNNWEIRPMSEYMRDPETRTGSSFDYAIEGREVDGTIMNAHGILEIKNVDALQFRDGWTIGENKEIEAPPHIEMQVQHQLLVSGRDFAYIGALVGGNTVKLIKRRRDEDVIHAILKRVDWFWKTIEANTPPKPDFLADADFISKTLYAKADEGTVVTADQALTDLAHKYIEAATKEREWTNVKKAVKAEILTLIGKNAKVIGDKFTISAGETAPTWVERYERKGFRNFRVIWSKKK